MTDLDAIRARDDHWQKQYVKAARSGGGLAINDYGLGIADRHDLIVLLDEAIERERRLRVAIDGMLRGLLVAVP